MSSKYRVSCDFVNWNKVLTTHRPVFTGSSMAPKAAVHENNQQLTSTHALHRQKMSNHGLPEISDCDHQQKHP